MKGKAGIGKAYRKFRNDLKPAEITALFRKVGWL